MCSSFGEPLDSLTDPFGEIWPQGSLSCLFPNMEEILLDKTPHLSSQPHLPPKKPQLSRGRALSPTSQGDTLMVREEDGGVLKLLK